MLKTGLLVLLATLLVAVSAVPNGADNPLDPDCFCVYDWRGPNGYYNYWVNSDIVLATYNDADHWTPDPSLDVVPCNVCFVNIQGRAVTFIDQYVDVNEMQIGGNEWDDTIVVVGGPGRNKGANVDLRIHYDFTPVIFTVTGERLANGDTLLTIIGRGFGFHASDLVISAVDYNQDTPDADCYVLNPSDASQYPQTISCPGRPSIIHYPPTALLPNYSYPCTHTRIFHHDSHISCTVSIPNAVPSELTVIVNTPNGKSASQSLLSEYIQ